jgi:hypothetical protein
MYFRQILHRDPGGAFSLIADQGEAAVIDPARCGAPTAREPS